MDRGELGAVRITAWNKYVCVTKLYVVQPNWRDLTEERQGWKDEGWNVEDFVLNFTQEAC